MNSRQASLTLISALGALEVQIAAWLLHEPLPVTQIHLCIVLHKSDKTVAKALYNLAIHQVCAHSPEGWSLTPEGASRLFNPSPLIDLPGNACLEDTRLVEAGPVEQPVEKGRKISESGLTTTSSIKLINNHYLEKNLLGAETEVENDPEAEAVLEPKNPELIRECLQAAHQVGIGEPKATAVARLAYTTPEMITGYVEAAIKAGQKIGLAIYRLEHHIPKEKPSKQEGQSLKDREWQERQRFVRGEHSDWVVH